MNFFKKYFKFFTILIIANIVIILISGNLYLSLIDGVSTRKIKQQIDNIKLSILAINQNISSLKEQKMSNDYSLSDEYSKLKIYSKNFHNLKIDINPKNIVTISGAAREMIFFVNKIYQLNIKNILQIYFLDLITTSNQVILTAKLYGDNNNE